MVGTVSLEAIPGRTGVECSRPRPGWVFGSTELWFKLPVASNSKEFMSGIRAQG